MAIPGVITLVTPKGGAGKTTLARCLAAHWFNLGFKSAVIDADPEKGVMLLHNSNDGPLKDLKIVAQPDEAIADDIQELKEERYSPILVDTAGFQNRTAIRAMVSSDITLIPAKANKQDLIGAAKTYRLIQQLNETPERSDGPPIIGRIVITMTKPGTNIVRYIRNQFDSYGIPVLEADMPDRVAYSEDTVTGLTPTFSNPDGAAAKDIAAIADEVSSLMKEIEQPFSKASNS